MKKFNVFFLAVFIICVANVHAAGKKHYVVKNPKLERRLKIEKKYISRNGDNLKRIAYRLYGHRTWWKKIQKKNPHLRRYSALRKIPTGTKIKYLAPVVGEEYVVQANDTLSRIAEWKFSNLDFWEKIYNNNIASISDPNKIEVGDKLMLSADGTIKKASTGEVLVDPRKEDEQNKFLVETAIIDNKNNDFIGQDSSIIIKIPLEYKEHIKIALIMLGLLLLLLIIYKIIQLQIKKQRMALGLKIGHVSKWKHRKYLNENFEVDKSLIRQDSSELKSGVSYHALKEKWWKKYLLLSKIRRS